MSAVDNQDNRLARHHNHPNGQETSFRISFTKKLPEKIKKALEEARGQESFHLGDGTFVERRKEVSNSGDEVVRHLENSFIELKIPDRIKAKFPGVLNEGCYVKIERTIEVKEKESRGNNSGQKRAKMEEFYKEVENKKQRVSEEPVDAFSFHPNSMPNIFGQEKGQLGKNGDFNFAHGLTKLLGKEFGRPTKSKIRPRFVEESSVVKINDVRGKKRRSSNDKKCRSKTPSKDQKERTSSKSIAKMGNKTIFDDKVDAASRSEDFSTTFFSPKEMERCRNKSASKSQAETQIANDSANYICAATKTTTTTTTTTSSDDVECQKVDANVEEERLNEKDANNEEERHAENATKNVEFQNVRMNSRPFVEENGQDISEKMTSQICDDEEVPQNSKRFGNDYDRIDFGESSLLRSLLTDKKRPNEFSNWTSTLEANADQDLDLENIMANILDLRDDELDRLLAAPQNDDENEEDFMDDDDVVNGGSPSAFSQTDSGFAAGSGSSRSIDENDEFGVNISRVENFMPSCEESLDESNIRNETSKNNFDSFREANIGNDTFVSNMNNETSSDNFPNGDSQHSTTNDLSGHSRSFSAKEKEKSLDRERDEENFETIAKVSDKLECENKDLLKVEFSTKTKIKILDEPQWMFCSIPGCGFWTRKPERMTRHKLCHLDEVKLSFQCPDCGVKFFSLTKLLKHDRKSHTGVKDYECRLCNAEVTDIQIHMRIHREDKEFNCRYCNAKFRHRSSLVRHLFLHTGHRPYKCQTCHAFFTGRDRLREHICRQHPDVVQNNQNMQSHLDQSRNAEKFFQEKYRTTKPDQISVSEIVLGLNPIHIQQPQHQQQQQQLQQPIYFQIGNFQFPAQQVQIVPIISSEYGSSAAAFPLQIASQSLGSQILFDGSNNDRIGQILFDGSNNERIGQILYEVSNNEQISQILVNGSNNDQIGPIIFDGFNNYRVIGTAHSPLETPSNSNSENLLDIAIREIGGFDEAKVTDDEAKELKNVETISLSDIQHLLLSQQVSNPDLKTVLQTINQTVIESEEILDKRATHEIAITQNVSSKVQKEIPNSSVPQSVSSTVHPDKDYFELRRVERNFSTSKDNSTQSEFVPISNSSEAEQFQKPFPRGQDKSENFKEIESLKRFNHNPLENIKLSENAKSFCKKIHKLGGRQSTATNLVPNQLIKESQRHASTSNKQTNGEETIEVIDIDVDAATLHKCTDEQKAKKRRRETNLQKKRNDKETKKRKEDVYYKEAEKNTKETILHLKVEEKKNEKEKRETGGDENEKRKEERETCDRDIKKKKIESKEKEKKVEETSENEMDEKVKEVEKIFSLKLSELRKCLKKSSPQMFSCSDCGKKYKFETFLKVHNKRPCNKN